MLYRNKLSLSIVLFALLVFLYLARVYWQTTQQVPVSFLNQVKNEPELVYKYKEMKDGQNVNHPDWKAYTNKKYNISFKYPSTWFIFIDSQGRKVSKVGFENEDFIFITPDEPCLGCGGVPRGVRISFGLNQTKQTTKAYVSENIIAKAEPGDNLVSYDADTPNIDAIIVEGYIGAGCPGPRLYSLTPKVALEMQTECLNQEDIDTIFQTIKIE